MEKNELSFDHFYIPFNSLGTEISLWFDPDRKWRSPKQIIPLEYFIKILANYFFIDDYRNMSKQDIDKLSSGLILKKCWNVDSIYQMPLRFWFRFKSQPCEKYHLLHYCIYGKKCWYFHEDDEIIHLDWDDIGRNTSHHIISSSSRLVHEIHNNKYLQYDPSKQLLILNSKSTLSSSSSSSLSSQLPSQSSIFNNQNENLNIWFCSFGCRNRITCHHHCLFYQSLINLTGEPLSSLISTLHPSISIPSFKLNNLLLRQMYNNNNTHSLTSTHLSTSSSISIFPTSFTSISTSVPSSSLMFLFPSSSSSSSSSSLSSSSLLSSLLSFSSFSSSSVPSSSSYTNHHHTYVDPIILQTKPSPLQMNIITSTSSKIFDNNNYHNNNNDDIFSLVLDNCFNLYNYTRLPVFISLCI
jgi:hypothetical protein